MTDSRQGIPFTKTSVFSSKTPLTGLLPLTNNRQARHTPRIVVYTRKLMLKTSLTGQSIHMFLTRHSSLVRRPTSTRRVRSSGVLDAACPLPERIGILFDDPLTPCLPPVSSTHYRIFAPAAKIANRHASSTAVVCSSRGFAPARPTLSTCVLCASAANFPSRRVQAYGVYRWTQKECIPGEWQCCLCVVAPCYRVARLTAQLE